MHLPKQLVYPDADTVVIFIHGFMGTPDHFDYLMDAVYQQGCSVVSLLLPGHGGSGFDFARSTLAQWEEHLAFAVAPFASYDNIYLVGHSIGGLLAYNLSLVLPVCGVVAISTPLKVYFFNPIASFKKLKILFSEKDGALRRGYRRSNSIEAPFLGKPRFRTLLFWIRVFFQPLRLMRKTRKNLPAVTAPSLTIHSKYDETVSFRSARLFARLLTGSKHEAILLLDSYHAYYPAHEQAVIERAVVSFVSKSYA